MEDFLPQGRRDVFLVSVVPGHVLGLPVAPVGEIWYRDSGCQGQRDSDPVLRKLWLAIFVEVSTRVTHVCLLSQLSSFWTAAAVGVLQLIQARSLCWCAKEMTSMMRLRMESVFFLLPAVL